MNCKIFFIFFLFLGCSQESFYEKVFRIEANQTKVDLHSVETIEQFDDLYCKGDKSAPLILPYNFDKGRLDYSSDFGIPATGDPMRCHPMMFCRYAVSFLVKDEFTWLDKYDSQIDKEALDSLVRLNILNNGYDPSLSDHPGDALFTIRAEGKTKLTELNLILSEISNSYLRILEEDVVESDNSGSEDFFPLNLIITTYLEIPPMPLDSAFMEEIEEEIRLML